MTTTTYDAKLDYMIDNAELDMKYGGENSERRNVILYTGITLLCFVFAQVYNRFSHGVYSTYMTYAFVFPLILGWVPALVFWRLPDVRRSGIISRNAWHSGIAAVTVSSLLRGIFEIAGTSSPYQSYLMIAGIAMLITGLAAFITKR